MDCIYSIRNKMNKHEDGKFKIMNVNIVITLHRLQITLNGTHNRTIHKNSLYVKYVKSYVSILLV